MKNIDQPDRIILNNMIKDYSYYLKGNMLDIGAGSNSRYHKHFKDNKITTLDINKDNNPDIIASADNLPVKDNSYNSILCTQVLEHTKEPLKVLKEMYRVLKPNGYALLTVPLFNELHEEPYDFFRYTKYGLLHLLSKVGFEEIIILNNGNFHILKAQLNIRYMINKYNLYNNKFYNTLFYMPLYLYCKYALSKTNIIDKYPLGYTILIKK